jgi:DNA-binding transcriptional ArsR family regulator
MARSQIRPTAPLPRRANKLARPESVSLVRNATPAYSLLHPIRRRILEALSEPDSASGVARRLRLSRQVVNYHVGEMARAHLLLPAGRRRRRNFLDRCYVASARGYLLSPEILGPLAADSRLTQDRFSCAYLLGLAGQIQSELGKVSAFAQKSGKTIATFSLNSTLRFTSPEQRAAFAEDLECSILAVVARHCSPAHNSDGSPSQGRPFRLALGCYPIEESSLSPKIPRQNHAKEIAP